jgi:hypothetical protein
VERVYRRFNEQNLLYGQWGRNRLAPDARGVSCYLGAKLYNIGNARAHDAAAVVVVGELACEGAILPGDSARLLIHLDLRLEELRGMQVK